MKYHVTPAFSKNLVTVHPRSIEKIGALVKIIENAKSENLLKDLSEFAVRLTEGDILVAVAGTARVFFTFGGEGDAKYLLLLDVIESEPASVATIATGRRSPITDSKLNPNINTRLNPYVNSRLNPFVNSQINPFVNSSLNPFVNSSLNPFVNSTLNPFVNSSLNPYVNSRLNPFVNTAINPHFNRNYEGPYLYDLGLRETGYVVKGSDTVILIFNGQNERTGLGAKNAIDGYTLFDASNNWTGQLIPDGQGGYLQYDKNSKWIGIVV